MNRSELNRSKSPSVPHRRGFVGRSRGVLLIALALLSASGAMVLSGTVDFAGSKSYSLLPDSDDLVLCLARVGLTPESVTAAGCSTQDAVELLNDAMNQLTPTYDALVDADNTLGKAQKSLDELERKIRAGTATLQEKQQHPASAATASTARAARDAVLDQLFTAAVTDLSSGEKAMLAQARANSAWNLPVEYRVAEKSEAQYVTLRAALADVRIAAKLGEDPRPESLQAISAANAVAATAAATTNLNNLTSIKEAWEFKIGQL